MAPAEVFTEHIEKLILLNFACWSEKLKKREKSAEK